MPETRLRTHKTSLQASNLALHEQLGNARHLVVLQMELDTSTCVKAYLRSVNGCNELKWFAVVMLRYHRRYVDHANGAEHPQSCVDFLRGYRDTR